MSSVTASPNPVTIDGRSTNVGTTTVTYQKDDVQELWIRLNGGQFRRGNEHILTGLGDEALRNGQFPLEVRAGGSATVAVFEPNHGPNAVDPIRAAAMTVFGILRAGRVDLIQDHSGSTGGTWLDRIVQTNVPTGVAVAAVGLRPASTDAEGVPKPNDPTVVLPPDPGLTMQHSLMFEPLVAGHRHFLTVVVVDRRGNWDVLSLEETTLPRRLTVGFPVLHIFNDGDEHDWGEGEFWFTVYEGSEGRPDGTLAEFHVPTTAIDDWSETDRPFGLPFTFTQQATVVPVESQHVWVGSRGLEHDGFIEFDEGAGLLGGRRIPLPTGRGENTSGSFQLDCPGVDVDFHYGVDVEFAVSYQS